MKIKINGVENKLIINGVKWSGDVESVARCLNFSFLYPKNDKNFKKYQVKCGDKVELLDDNNVVKFFGMVYQVNFSTEAQIVDVECYDLLMNVVKSKFVGRFRNTLDNIANQICNTFNLKSGIKTGKQQIHNILSTGDMSYYDVLKTACNSLYGEKFNLYIDNKTLKLQLYTDETTEKLETGKNILNAGYSSDISNMVNKVLIVETKTKDDVTTYKVHGSVQNNNDIQTFGLFQDVYSYDEKDKDNVKNAKEQLKTVANKSSFSALGNNNVIAGSVIEIYEPLTKAKGKFFVESDIHTYGVTHLMELGVKYIE